MSGKEKKVCLALVWHMHQPDYRDPETGAAMMPWVRLHAAKDYADMPSLVAEFPRVRQTFNLTPVLVDQLVHISSGGEEAFLGLCEKPVGELTLHERKAVIRQCFMLNWTRLVEPVERYRKLLDIRGRKPEDGDDADERFGEQDLLDLQVLFHLAWTDAFWRKAEPWLEDLAARSGGFTEADKGRLLALHRRIAGAIPGIYRDLSGKGLIEVSFSPGTHPIGPLLIDQRCALEARPGMKLPGRTFEGTEDVRWHLKAAVESSSLVLGKQARGMWPSEGGISEAFLALAADHGFEWVASDEEVLRESLVLAGKAVGGVPHCGAYIYRTGNTALNLIFREHALADMIGFVYSRWDARDATSDFVSRVRSFAGKSPQAGAPPLVAVILDGENAWEHYANDGKDFLRALYGLLSSDDVVECVTVGDYLRTYGARIELPRIRAGSWINHDFGVWMGHEEDRTSWELLAGARDALLGSRDSLGREPFEEGRKRLMVAEGSDWNWWYGDEHWTPQAAEFDRLYRANLAKVFALAGAAVPERLLKPLKKGLSAPPLQDPTDVLDVTIDGRMTSYFEWLPAGRYDTEHAAAEMHRSAPLLAMVHFGCDAMGRLLVRLDPEEHLSVMRGCRIVLRVLKPVQEEVTFDLARETDAGKVSAGLLSVEYAVGTVIEARLAAEGRQVPWSFSVAVVGTVSGRTLEEWPSAGAIEVRTPSREDREKDWMV